MTPQGWARSLRMLNLLDVLGTLLTVTVLHAHETNPLMGALIGISPVLFVVVKIIGVAIASEFLASRGRVGMLVVANVFYLTAVAAHVHCCL